MRLSTRSYPHPVIGNRDDVPAAAFQVALVMSTDKQSIYVNADVTCSCEALNSLVAAGRASFVLHIECSNTLFRRAYEFSDYQHRISIPIENLNDVVEVNVFAVALDHIPDYRIPEAHSDYTDNIFDIRHGDILAVAEGQVFHIESNFDSFSRIGSIMQISESFKDGDIPMEPNFDGQKIVIYLSKKDFVDYKLLKYHEDVCGLLTTTIVLPVLVEALYMLRSEGESMYDTNRWIRALQHRIDDNGLNIGMQPLFLAQTILDLPIKRVLSSAHMLAGAMS